MVIVLPEEVAVAKKVNVVLPVVPERVLDKVITKPAILTTVVPEGRVNEPAVLVVTATNMPG